MYLPDRINKIVEGLDPRNDDIGKSGDVVLIYEERFVLKISTEIERLKREYEKDLWLCDRIPSPRPIAFEKEENKAYYLRTYIKGKSLIDEEYIKNPGKLIDLMVLAFSMLRTLDNANCPFRSADSEGEFFVHGDICLPNIIANGNEIVGFIDLENSGLGDIWYDYAWMIWSLTRNLKTKDYNKVLLDKLGIEFNEKRFNKYIPEELKAQW